MQSPIQGKFLEEDGPNEAVDSVFAALGTNPAAPGTPANPVPTIMYAPGATDVPSPQGYRYSGNQTTPVQSDADVVEHSVVPIHIPNQPDASAPSEPEIPQWSQQLASDFEDAMAQVNRYPALYAAATPVRNLIPQAEFSASWSDPSGGSHVESGTTAAQLLAALNNIQANGGLIDQLVVKGHGNPEGILDDYGNGSLISDPRNNAVYSNNVNVTDVLRSITNESSEISLRGCSSWEAGRDVAAILNNGAVVSGFLGLSPMEIPFTTISTPRIPLSIGIPFTTLAVGIPITFQYSHGLDVSR